MTRYNKHSEIGGKEIVYHMWLVFDEAGSCRMIRTEPALERGERAMKLAITVPRAVFRTPLLQATVTVPSPSVDPSGKITADVKLAAEDALKAVFGVDVKLEVLPPTP